MARQAVGRLVALDVQAVTTLPLHLLDSFDRNPREELYDLGGLADTIREYGIVEPIVVTPNGDGRYTVLSGHRRAAAARMAGLANVPVQIRATPDSALTTIALIANTQRVDLTPLEEARAYRTLVDEHGWTQRELCERVGKSQGHVSKRLALLDLPPDVRGRVAAGTLRPDHALRGRVANPRAVIAEQTELPSEARIVAVDAGRLIQRLATRERGKGLQLSDPECEALIQIIKTAAEALRQAA